MSRMSRPRSAEATVSPLNPLTVLPSKVKLTGCERSMRPRPSTRMARLPGEICPQNLVRDRVARHHKPRAAARAVMPQLSRLARRVLAVVEVVVPCLRRSLRVGAVEVGLVTLDAEFADVAGPAEGTGDLHVRSP